MRKLTLVQGRVNGMYKEENAVWFEFGNTIYDGVFFLTDMDHYEQSVNDVDDLVSDFSMVLGMYCSDEVEVIVHELIMAHAGDLSEAEIVDVLNNH